MQDIKLSDLEKIGVLGSGAFGQVMLVKYEGQYMALKTLSKQQIIEMGLQVSFSCQPLRQCGLMSTAASAAQLQGVAYPIGAFSSGWVRDLEVWASISPGASCMCASMLAGGGTCHERRVACRSM